MIVLGLTGSIGMGKSNAAAALRRLGVPVAESDCIVHALYRPGGAAVAAVEALFPGTVKDGTVDRRALSERVVKDPAALKRLEAAVHPLVRAAQDKFLRMAASRGHRLVALDVPLLFEVGGDRRADYVVVVSAPPFVQRSRVLHRPGMSDAKLAAMLARQMPDAQKRRRADFVIPTGLSRGHTLRRLKSLVKLLKTRPPPPRHARNRRRH